MKIAMIGHKRIPSREGGVEIVVEEHFFNIHPLNEIFVEKHFLMVLQMNIAGLKLQGEFSFYH